MVKEISPNKIFESITCAKKNLCQKNWVQNNLGHTKFWAKKYFGQNNSLVKRNGMPKNLDQKSLVKIGSETAKIFLYGQMLPGQMLPG